MNVRWLVACGITWSVLGLLALQGRAEEAGLAPRLHAWAQFQPGAWKLVRVVSQTFDEQGSAVSTSTTETRTILIEVSQDSVTLELDAIVEVAGKRFAAEPQIVKQGFHGDAVNQDLKLKEPVAGQVTIEGRKIPCRIVQLECDGTTSKTITSLYCSDTVAPFMLRRESVTSDLAGKNTLSETTVEVFTQDMPWRVRSEIKNACIFRTVHKHPKGTVTTWAISSTAVPGGVVSHSSKETDRNGRLIGLSTLELVDYGLQCDEEDKGGILRGKRRARYREPAPRYPQR